MDARLNPKSQLRVCRNRSSNQIIPNPARHGSHMQKSSEAIERTLHQNCEPMSEMGTMETY